MSDLTPDSRDLIHDRQALDDLQLTYQAFLTVLHEPEMLFAILDAQGRTLMANETLARSLHRSPEQMTGRLIFDLMPVEEAKFRRDVFEQVVRAGEALRVDDLTDSGKIFDSSVFPIFDAQGKLAKVVVLARDVTAHRQMEAALRASEARYRALTEIAPAAIVMTDLGGKLLLANPSFARLMGYSNAEAALGEIGIVQRIFSAHDQPALERLLARLLAGGQVGPADLEVQRKDGEPRTVAAHGAVLPGETGATLGMIIYLQDVTATRHEHRELLLARRELEQRVQARTAELEQMNESLHNEILAHYETDTALRQAAARANALARVAERINAELDLTATLQAICDETGTTLGYEHGAILLYREDQDALAAAAASGAHHLPVELIPPVPRRLYESYLERLGRVIIIPDWRSLRERFPDFVNRLDIRTVVSVPFYHDGDLQGAMIVASENETRLPQNEDVRLLQALAQQAGIAITNAQLFQEVSDSRERLQRLAGRLAEMQEGERRRLAHDLHEDIGQVLASLGIRVELAERQWEAACGADAGGAAANAHAAARAELSGARQVINGLIEYVRDVAEELRPAELDDLGLVPSLSNYFERFTAQTGVQVDFRHSQVDERYGDRLETAVFRIVQNALQNVAQHAGTAQAVVRLWRSSGHLELQVHDQGCGFDLQQTLAAQPCIGLVEMTERASAYGGRLEVDTAVGNGTRVTADFPLPEPADTASTA